VKRAWVILAAGVLLACAAAAKDPQAHASGDDDNPGRGVNIYSLQRKLNWAGRWRPRSSGRRGCSTTRWWRNT